MAWVAAITAHSPGTNTVYEHLSTHMKEITDSVGPLYNADDEGFENGNNLNKRIKERLVFLTGAAAPDSYEQTREVRLADGSVGTRTLTVKASASMATQLSEALHFRHIVRHRRPQHAVDASRSWALSEAVHQVKREEKNTKREKYSDCLAEAAAALEIEK